MKKMILIIVICLLAVLLYKKEIAPAVSSFEQSNGLVLDAKAAVLLDPESGEFYFAKHADAPYAPASMSKMMTELLVLDAIGAGKIHWNETVHVSAYAASVPGAQADLQQGEKLTVEELMNATAIYSANDAAVALAELVGGTEKDFVRQMNKKAKEIGLSSKTKFANATGLPAADLRGLEGAATAGDTRMTARDSARLAAYLIKRYPLILDITRKEEVKLPGKPALPSTNQMLPGGAFAYPGNDGLKTGYTDDAGYCFTGTAEQNGRRLIAVVMGTPTADARFTETEKLFAYGFGMDDGSKK
ncbi:D-alanyl-D-alanine carboxypeptidase family protein [Gorillibacterium massiliense]|uniref:D-alanyl-D-alanine carboxypeptidase family protein n=1 Tax=Gorillibacterium massiliense TaxID=1280390 RepID=UPI0004B041FA|nr:D-alanyl-D-alanine carboxypeptidase family protein [Gorillibacterium massiliense]